MIFDELKPGRTVQKNPIQAYKSDLKSRKFIYLLAGINGKEIEGIYTLKNLFHWLRFDHSMEDLPIIVVPILNIDGYEEATRDNALGINILQNFPSEENQGKELEPETTFLIRLFKKYNPASFIYFGAGKPPRIEFCSKGKQLGNYLSKLNFYDLKKLEDSSLHSLGRYLHQEYDCPFINLKCPKIADDLSLQDIWDHNEKSLKDLIRSELLLKSIKCTEKSFVSKILPRI